MGKNPTSTSFAGRMAPLLICLCVGAYLPSAAVAQDSAPAGARPPAEQPGFLAAVGHWFDEQAAKFNSNLKDAGSKVENFGHEAGAAAKSTVEGAKDAAGAVVRIPLGHTVTGHAKCALAPNGAPNCVAAATQICKTKGYTSGKSVDTTTSEVCPAQVYLSGRTSGEGCYTETFVSGAICE